MHFPKHEGYFVKSPPTENQTMKKASTIAIIVTTLFYLSRGGFGYAAFGDDSPGNFLMVFEFFKPHKLIDFANAYVVLHLVGGYQVQLYMLRLSHLNLLILVAILIPCHYKE